IDNPDPKDTDGLADDPAILDEDIRREHKMNAQRFANLDVDPDAELLVFVGRWSFQKGVDLIADLMPKVMAEYPNVQVVCIGPHIDLYGKFAAIKFEQLMEQYPGRIFSKPKFMEIPESLFFGADFVLIPSRDEPFGLVAVEFGRKGVLGIGSKIGGLGKMPGWWYPVESSEVHHLHKQFMRTIRMALSSSPETRYNMRVAAMKQRFGVSNWVRKTQRQHMTAIEASQGASRLPEATPPGINVLSSQRSNAGDSFRSGHHAASETASTYLGPHSFKAKPSMASVASYFSNAKSITRSTTALLLEENTDSIRVRLRDEDYFELSDLSTVNVNEKGKTQFFTDEDGNASYKYSDMLRSLDVKNSTKGLCIDSFLVLCKDDFYETNHKLDWAQQSLPARFLRYKIFDWPVYTLLL
ncbi:Cell wall alpha-1,3-glucan synthase ags1, partial [Entophlyctis sp. JEL0112]